MTTMIMVTTAMLIALTTTIRTTIATTMDMGIIILNQPITVINRIILYYNLDGNHDIFMVSSIIK